MNRYADRIVGTISGVAPNRIEVLLEYDAPQGTALVQGEPSAFPRVNSYLLVPGEGGTIVGQIEWIKVKDSAFPRRPGLRDFGLVDLPFPLREVSIVPVGTLQRAHSSGRPMELIRGVPNLPSIGDPVLLPTSEELVSILSPASGRGRVWIGDSAVGAGIKIEVDPDIIFGHHLAVLGNTGSGKSSSIAGLIRWSIDAATRATDEDKTPVLRFLVLDPNGEYQQALSDTSDSVLVLRPEVSIEDGQIPLQVPAWLWDSAEWAAFSRAAPQTQRPALIQALTELRSGTSIEVTSQMAAAKLIRPIVRSLRSATADGATFTEWRFWQDLGRTLAVLASAAERCAATSEGALAIWLKQVETEASAVEVTRGYHHDQSGERRYQAFTLSDFDPLFGLTDAIDEHLPRTSYGQSTSPDVPSSFDVDEMPGQIESLPDRNAALSNSHQNLIPLVLRIETILRDQRFRSVLGADSDLTLVDWLEGFLGGSEGRIAIVDLSLVPSEVLELTTAVIARVTFEAVRRHARIAGGLVPTVLVLEEAHRFVPRSSSDGDEDGLSSVARRTFERVAREGRKFGMGLVVSSQRPADVSATILSQCNSFLLHRIVNDRDQDIVRRLVPDNAGAILGELPSLPQRHAILLGAATLLPVRLEIRELLPSQRPRSADPGFWDAWTAQDGVTVDWSAVAADWLGSVES